MLKAQQNYKVGIYVRLSKDDERAGESVSIENQNLMLTKYCEEQSWNDVTVKSMLRSEVYIGHMVQNKRGTLSYKNKKQVDKPKEDWIKVKNTHESIIDMDTWNACLEVDARNYKLRPTKESEISLFGGLLRCMDCGFKMRYSQETHDIEQLIDPFV